MQLTSAKVRITGVDRCELTSVRPRSIGCNSVRGSHGSVITEPIVRIYTDAGVVGWGSSSATKPMAEYFLGKRLDEVWSLTEGASFGYELFDTALWDVVGRLEKKPVHALLGSHGQSSVPIYDGSIYIEDVDPESGKDRGLEPVTDAVRMGLEYGFTAFKMKIGRGNKWMEREFGFRRDVEAIRLVRELIGPEYRLLIDANNAYTQEEARELTRQVRDCRIFWFEEPFKEEVEVSRAFKRFLHEESPEILLADGEGTRPYEAEIRTVLHAASIDVVQFDLRPVPIGSWLSVLPIIEEKGMLAAPHNWHSFLLNYCVPHFGRGIRIFAMGETDRSTCDLVDAGAYRMVNGMLEIPDKPGFGLELDHAAVDRLVEDDGWTVKA